MILFMVYAATLGAVLAVAAARAEAALQGRGLPSRGAWAASLAASVGLPAWALFRPAPAARETGWAEVPVVVLTELRAAVVPEPALMVRADSVALALWVAGSAAMALALAVGLLRLARRMRRWAPARIADAPVLLSDDFGPAVLGVRSPTVVLPRWALALDPERLRLVVLHEDEHRRARDVSLLLGGALAVVLAPWNPALWWQVRRLRGAVEMDCDARVLRRGAPAPLYGRLLLELGIREPGIPLPVATLARQTSLLERRLTMIVRGGERRSVARTLGALTVAGALVVVACEAPMPTAVRPTEPVAGDEAAAVVPQKQFELQGLIEAQSGGNPVLMVDGARVEDLLHVAREDIVRVEVMKGPAATAAYGSEGEDGVIHVITGNAPAGLLRVVEGGAEGATAAPAPGASGGTLVRVAEPEIYVDGKLFEGDLKSIDKNTIDRVDVVKSKDPGQRPKVYVTLKKIGG